MRPAGAITKEELRALYNDNPQGTIRNTAKALGCSMTTVLKALARHGLERKSKTRFWHRSTRFPLLNNKEWFEAQLETKTINQIAAELGTTNGNVSDHAYRLGLRERGARRSQSVRNALQIRFPHGRYGSLAANWRGGRNMTSGGHVYVHAPDHPHASDGGYVMEHRLVVEKHLGRYLMPDEIVHHRNDIKTDNRLENLEVMTRTEHRREHMNAHAKLYEATQAIVHLQDWLTETLDRITQLETFIRSHGLTPPGEPSEPQT